MEEPEGGLDHLLVFFMFGYKRNPCSILFYPPSQSSLPAQHKVWFLHQKGALKKQTLVLQFHHISQETQVMRHIETHLAEVDKSFVPEIKVREDLLYEGTIRKVQCSDEFLVSHNTPAHTHSCRSSVTNSRKQLRQVSCFWIVVNCGQ